MHPSVLSGMGVGRTARGLHGPYAWVLSHVLVGGQRAQHEGAACFLLRIWPRRNNLHEADHARACTPAEIAIQFRPLRDLQKYFHLMYGWRQVLEWFVCASVYLLAVEMILSRLASRSLCVKRDQERTVGWRLKRAFDGVRRCWPTSAPGARQRRRGRRERARCASRRSPPQSRRRSARWYFSASQIVLDVF